MSSKGFATIALALVVLGGCAGGISDNALRAVDHSVTLTAPQGPIVQIAATELPNLDQTAQPLDAPRDDSSDDVLLRHAVARSALAAVAQPTKLQPVAARLMLEDLEQIALANNPTLQKAAEAVEIARGIRLQVGLYPNPVVGYSGQEIGDEGTAGQQGGFISQEIVTAGKLRLNRATAQEAVRQAQADFEAQRYRVLNAVRTRFYEVLSAHESVNLSEQLVQVADRAANAARELFELQQGTRPDLLQARIELEGARILEENARNRYQAAWQQLANVVGRPEMPPAPLEGDLRAAVPDLDREQIWQQLLALSPELSAAEANTRRAEIALSRARVEPVPNLVTQASVSSNRSNGDTLTGVQVGVELPLFDRNQGNIRAAEADLRRARAEYGRVQLALRDRLAAAFERYANARQQVEKYRADILPDSQENLDLITEGYRRGQFDFLQLLVAQRTYFQTNLAYIGSLTNHWRNAVEISGLLLTDGLGEPAVEDGSTSPKLTPLPY